MLLWLPSFIPENGDSVMPLELATSRVNPETAVVTLSGGPLTLGAGLKLADSQLHNLIDSGVSRIVLDLTAVAYADSAGLGLLVHTYGLMQEKGGVLRLCGVADRVASMLKMTRTAELFPVDADAQASLASLP